MRSPKLSAPDSAFLQQSPLLPHKHSEKANGQARKREKTLTPSDGKHSSPTQKEAQLWAVTVIPSPDQPPGCLPQEALLENQSHSSRPVRMPTETLTRSTDSWLGPDPRQDLPSSAFTVERCQTSLRIRNWQTFDMYSPR